MAGINRTTGKATDLITFSRSSRGTALRKISYGSELVTNGTFDSADGWTAATGWTIGGGVATCDGTNAAQITQGSSAVAGRVYQVTYTVTAYTSGSLRVVLGTYTDTVSSSTGTYTLYLVAPSSGAIGFRSGSYIGTIDNISVKEVLFDQPDGTLTLFNHPDNIPRIEYGADGTVKGLLIEESRTNLVTYSEDFTNASWVKINTATLSADATGPDGGTSAVTLVDNGASGTGEVQVTRTVSVATSTAHTFSVYLKASGLSWAVLRASGFTSGDGVTYFDLANGTTGTVAAAHTARVQDAGNGWYRCSVTFTTDAADTSGNIHIYVAEANNDASVDLDGTSSILIYGAQLEAGSFPTSYIPTSGATATRAADIASISVDNFGYRQGVGTLFVDVNSFGDNTYQYAAALTPPTANGLTEISLRKSTSSWNYAVVDSGASQASMTEAFVSQAKLAGAYKANSFNASINGSTETEDTSGTVPSGLVDLRIGRQTSFQLNGHIKSIAYYPRRLSNAQLVQLTA